MKKTFLILPFFLLISSCMKSVGNIPNGKNPDAVGSCVVSSKDSIIDLTRNINNNNDLSKFSCNDIDLKAIESCKIRGKKLVGYRIDRFESHSSSNTNPVFALLAKTETRKEYEVYCE